MLRWRERSSASSIRSWGHAGKRARGVETRVVGVLVSVYKGGLRWLARVVVVVVGGVGAVAVGGDY
jgi:hypothetical protein